MRNDFFPLDHEGWRFAGICAAATFLLGLLSPHLGWIGVIITAWCAFFFRDPERVIPDRSGIMISPADGSVQKISQCVAPAEFSLGDKQVTKVSIFMSVFNVHVNRTPVAGLVEKIIYIPGKFFNATLDKASEHNERQAVVVKMENGTKVAFVRIAGLIARRIRSDISEGEMLDIGQRVGIIRFGSRVDIYLPKNTKLLIEEGQTMVAGETVIAEFTK